MAMMPDSAPQIPSVSVDTSAYAPEHRIDAWCRFNAGLFELRKHEIPEQGFAASAQSYRVGQAVLGRYSVTGNIVRRAENRLKVEREDLFVLRVHRAGYTKGVMSDASFTMQSDRFTLFDFHQDLNAETENVDYISVTMPYAAIGYDPSRHSKLLQLPYASPVGRVLRSNLEMMLELAPTLTQSEAAVLADGFSGLLKGIITRDLRDESVFQKSQQSLEVAARRFVESNLREPSLDVGTICRSIGVSRPTLYRMFADDGGVGRAITKQRLERAFEDLAASEPTRGAIARIARYWAFSDPAYFSRLFRDTFGVTPSEAIGSSIGSLKPSPLGRRYHSRASERPSWSLVDLYNMGGTASVS